MLTDHPAARRSFVQTGGMPLSDDHRLLRDDFDTVASVEWIGSGCFKLRGDAGEQIGIIQFQGTRAGSIDDRMEKQLRDALEGLTRQPDPAAGDTVIRPLNMANPEDAEIMKLAMQGEGRGVVHGHTPDLPPIDMPDYAGDDRDPVPVYGMPDTWDRYPFALGAESASERPREGWAIFWAVIAGLLFAAIVSGLLIYIYGGAHHA